MNVERESEQAKKNKQKGEKSEENGNNILHELM